MSVHILYVEGVLGARFDEFIIDNTYKLEGGRTKKVFSHISPIFYKGK